jgi:hypothetical protein
MSLYERYPLSRAVETDMEDLPMKPRSAPTVKRKPASSASPSPRRRSTATRNQTAKTASRPVKPLPPMKSTEQPRDSLGRFARKTGAVLWSGAKATGRAIRGTARGIKKAHKTVKRFNADMRRRDRLEERERRIALAEREKKLGLRKKKVVRRRKR